MVNILATPRLPPLAELRPTYRPSSRVAVIWLPLTRRPTWVALQLVRQRHQLTPTPLGARMQDIHMHRVQQAVALTRSHVHYDWTRFDEAGEAAPSDWTRFDVSASLRALRSNDDNVVARELRKLHLRWWHAGPTAMANALRPTGIPESILQKIPDTVKSCRECRIWARPGPDTIPSMTVAEKSSL